MPYREDATLEIWRYDGATPLDESTVTTGWLPSGPDWTDQSASLVGTVTLRLDPADHGWTADVSLRQESRLDWSEGKPCALVASHWTDDSGVGPRTTILFGYLQAEGESVLRRDGTAVATRSIGYATEWARRNVPAMQMGRPNLLENATWDSSKSVATSTTPSDEVEFGEYIVPGDVSGAAAIDGNSDTPAVSDLIAELAPATSYGNTTFGGRPIPRVAKLYGGRSSRTIGAGDESIFVVLTCRARMFTWGDMADPTLVPAFYEESVGSTYPAQKTETMRNTFFVAGGNRFGTGYSLRVRCKAGVSPDPQIRTGIQWNTSSTWYDLPAKLVFWARAADSNTIGKRLLVTLKPASPQDNNSTTLDAVLTATYQRFEIPLQSLGSYGGVMIRFQNEAGEIASTDMLFDLVDVDILAGYSDEAQAVVSNTRFHVAYDDGNGHEGYVRVAWNLAPSNWTIPPEGAIILCDDESAFRAKFDPGTFPVYSMRARAPFFYFAPAVGRFKTVLAQNPSLVDYDSTSGGVVQIEEILFSGLSWTQGANPQMLRRDSPLLTGSFVTDNYPTLTIDTVDTFGPSYWTYSFPAYAPPTLTADLSSAGVSALVSSVDDYEASGVVQIDNELIAYGSTEDGALNLTTRGYNPSGPPFTSGPGVPAAHTVGAAVRPWRNGAAQIGHLLADVDVRRRPGTSRILAATLLYSNSASPPDPHPAFELTVGGDWKVFGSITNQASEVATVSAPTGTYVEARWLTLIIRNMERVNGVAQHGKVNELVARAYAPGAAGVGLYRSRQVATVPDLVGYLLVQRGGLSVAKYAPGAVPVPIDALPIARGSLAQALDAATKLGGLSVWADELGYVRLVPSPASAYFAAPDVARTWTIDDLREEPSIRWRSARSVAQVSLVAREVSGLRTHSVLYPPTPGSYGAFLEAKDVTVANVAQAIAHARALFSQANAQRTPPVVTGYVPGLALYDRHVVNLPDADAGGQIVGVNCYVTGARVTITPAANGSLLWRTTINLEELAV